ncbi:nucleotidyltransferase family protein [Brevibacterium sp.]|uniref:nucleotidyltransferase family protein n=1 Tax=Brevibacterium sp. TaxID=1701 RepID=UPI0028123313|nr:nucleotidyltransferase family protein [Brevibacterium sp.]
MSPVGLVLAAGAGRRLGLGPKALLRRGSATLVETAVETLLAGGCSRVIVVTGAGAAAVTDLLNDHPRVALAHNPDWETGMGSSLRCGLLAAEPDRGVLVVPVDRPGLTVAEVARVIAANRPGAITAAAHRDRSGRLRRGHPVLFDSRWVGPAAASAHDDVGARDLLATVPDIVALIDCSDLDDGRDIDVPADWEGVGAAEQDATSPE